MYEFHLQFCSTKLKSIRTHIVGDKCHAPPPPPLQPIATSRQGLQSCGAALESMIYDSLMNMHEVFLSASCCPIPLFSTPASLHYCFSWCAVGERGQPHPSAEWHSMRRRKEEEKSCLVLPLMSKSMHLSLKRWEREKEREAIGTPRTRPKHSHRSSYHMLWIGAFFNLAQQYISPEPLIGQSCN